MSGPFVSATVFADGEAFYVLEDEDHPLLSVYRYRGDDIVWKATQLGGLEPLALAKMIFGEPLESFHS